MATESNLILFLSYGILMNVKQSCKVNKPNGTGLIRIMKAFKCSMQGFKAAYIHESAFRQETLLFFLLFPCSFIISSTIYSWLALVCSLLFLLLIEIVNSAIEALADRISIEYSELIGRAKDLGSAAVFLAMIMVFLVWGTTLYHYLYLAK